MAGIALALSVSSCRWKTTKTALKNGEVLKASVESFEKNRKILSDKLITSLEEAEESLTQESPDLPQVSKDFEIEWNNIQKRYEKIKLDFGDVGEN